MTKKAMIHAGSRTQEARESLQRAGGELIADYGQSLLARASQDALRSMETQGFRVRILTEDTKLNVRGFQLETNHPGMRATSANTRATAPASGRVHQLLRLAGPMHIDWKTRLERLGVTFLENLDGDLYLIAVNSSEIDDLQNLNFVESVSPYMPALKVSPELLSQSLSAKLATTRALTALPGVSSTDTSSGREQSGIDFTRPGFSATKAGPAGTRLGNLELVLFDDQDQHLVTTALNAMGIGIASASGGTIIVNAAEDQIAKIADLPQIRQINPFSPPKFHNNVATGIVNVDVLRNDHELDGSGQIVSVADSGLDTGVNDATMLVDFQGRIVSIYALGRPGDASDVNNHGTHVAGSVLGDGANSNGNIRGMAPAASVVFQSLEDAGGGLGGIPANLGVGLFDVARGDGARIHTNSWGADVNGAYTASASQADAFAFNNRDSLILYSAGNEAPNRVNSPGSAKNVLTVGASESTRPLPVSVTFPASPAFPTGAVWNNFNIQADNINQVASFSSPGPAANNRRKPDVVAPGTFILSTRSTLSVDDNGPDGIPGTGDEDGIFTHAEAVGLGLPGAPVFGTGSANLPAAPPGSGVAANTNYMYLNGTSMATPITAGSCALVRQYLIEQRNHTPSGALVKAIMVNGALDMGLGVPNVNQGWGRIDLENALFPAGTERVQFDDNLDNAVATGDIRTYDIYVSSVANPLAVTLVWRDPAGSTIQNRLHLRVIHPATATTTSSDLIADIRNNVQKVIINPPVVGLYQIEVEGVNVITGIPELAGTRQDYALVVSNATGFSCNPSDLVQIIDRSGSMDYYGYMEPAKERAKQLVDILQINDQTGLVTFNQSAAPGTPIPLTAIASQSDKTNIKAQIDTITASGLTDLREALEDGLATLGPDTGRPRALIFLSDGHHTVATPTIDAAFLASIAAANVKVYTIALGPASDAAVLNQIASATGTGSVYTVESAADLNKLHQIYYDILGGLGCGGVIHLNSSTPAFGQTLVESADVDRSSGEALFSLSWEDPNADFDFTLRRPDGKTIDPKSKGVVFVSGSSYKFYRIGLPMSGTWQLHTKANPDRQTQNLRMTTAVLGANEVRVEATVDPKYLFFRKLLISLKAFHKKRPLIKGSATATITFPTLSIDDLLRIHADELKEIKIDPDGLRGAADPIGLARLNLFAASKGRKGIDIFQRKTLKIELTDNGKDEDPKPDDGIYTGFLDLSQIPASGDMEIRIDFKVDDEKLGPYQKTQILPIHVPVVKRTQISIGEVKLRRNRLWKYSLLTVKVKLPNGQTASPRDGITVNATMAQPNERKVTAKLEYYSRSKYYRWRIPHEQFTSKKVAFQITAMLDDQQVAESSITAKV